MLEITLFGAPRVTVVGRPVAFDTRKAVALLAHLAMAGGPRSRAQLAALLWPEYDDEHARGALRRTLSTMRSALDGPWLEVDRSRVALGDGVACDVATFRSLTDASRRHQHDAVTGCALCLDGLKSAARLHTDDFMAGFALRDSPEFDDWQAQEAEQLRRELSSVLEILAGGAIRDGALDLAIEHTGRLLRMDRLNESAHRSLMELYAWNGDRSTAMRQYRECVRILDQELGVAPLPDTTELYERVLAGEVPTLSARLPAVTARPRTGGPPPLVGRDRELAAIVDAWRAVGPHGGRVVRVEGAPGIGKTRLVAEAVDHVRTEGARVLALRCFEGEVGLAYAPLAEGLARLGDAEMAALAAHAPSQAIVEAARIAPALVRDHPDLSPEQVDESAASLRLIDGLATVLSAVVAGPVPGVVCVDDAQWADQGTATVLGYLLRRLSAHRACFIIVRRGAPEGIDVLGPALAVARRDGRLVHLSLEPLTDASAAELVRSQIPDAEASLVQKLTAESEGNPFYMVEYLAQLRTAETPEQADHLESLPPGVRELVASRLAGLDEVERQVLAAAAILGRTFDPDLVRRVSGRTTDELVGALERLRDRGLVVERRGAVTGPDWDFDHDKTRAVVLQQMAITRRRVLHQRTATALESWRLPGGRRPLAAIAEHLISAGQPLAAAAWHLLAGDEAAELHANADAIEHFSAAIALAPDAAVGLRRRIGDLEKLRGRYREALAAYRGEAAVAPAADVPDLEHRMARVHLRLGEWAMAAAYLESALAGLPSDAAEARAGVLVDGSLAAARLGDEDEAERQARLALNLADAAGEAGLRAEAHNQLGLLARRRGTLDEARHHLEEGLRLAEEGAVPAAIMAARNNLARLELAEGHAEAAEQLTRAALDTAVGIGDRHREAALRNNLADLLHALGRTDDAMAELKRSVTLFAEIGETSTLQPEIWKLVEW